MSRQGKAILSTLYDEGVITLADIQEFLDSKKPTTVKTKRSVGKSETVSKVPVYTDPCSRGGGHGHRSSC